MANLVRSLDPGVLDDLRERGRPVRFAAGESVMSERAEAERVLLLESGYVKISRAAPAGREIVLDFRGPGELLGEQSVLRAAPRSATVTTLTDVAALAIAGSAFVQWATASPAAALAIMHVLGDRLQESDHQRVEYGASRTIARVAARLLSLADRFGEAAADGGVEIGLAISQEELAAWSGSSREATVKALRTLRSLGLVETSRRRILVRDPAQLASHAS